MTAGNGSGRQATVLVMLVVLALVSVGVHLMHLVYGIAIPLYALVALAMTSLVTGKYMRLTAEGNLIFFLAGIPVFLFVVLVVLLIPDIAIHHTILTGGK
jgi:hypothetical protein